MTALWSKVSKVQVQDRAEPGVQKSDSGYFGLARKACGVSGFWALAQPDYISMTEQDSSGAFLLFTFVVMQELPTRDLRGRAAAVLSEEALAGNSVGFVVMTLQQLRL